MAETVDLGQEPVTPNDDGGGKKQRGNGERIRGQSPLPAAAHYCERME